MFLYSPFPILDLLNKIYIDPPLWFTVSLLVLLCFRSSVFRKVFLVYSVSFGVTYYIITSLEDYPNFFIQKYLEYVAFPTFLFLMAIACLFYWLCGCILGVFRFFPFFH